MLTSKPSKPSTLESLSINLDSIKKLKGKTKVIYQQNCTEMGISLLYFIDKQLNLDIVFSDNRFYLKNRNKLKNIEKITSIDERYNIHLHEKELDKIKSKEKEFNYKYMFPLLESKNTEFTWDNKVYYISIIKESNELCKTDVYGIHDPVYNYKYITVISTDESRESISMLANEARKYFRENILEEFCDENKVKVKLFYDGYWEMLHKIPARSLDTIYLPNNIIKKFINFLEDWDTIKNEKWHIKMGIPYKLNILLHGYPGTGKTSLIESIAALLKREIYILNFNTKIDDSSFMRSFRDIGDKSILVLEDIDCLFTERKENDNSRHMVTFSGLLNVLDGIACKNGLITFITTNYKARLDTALIRPGRIDYKIRFEYATKEQINNMYNKFFPNKSTEDFESFYKEIRTLKITMCQMQQFFYTNYKTQNLLNNIHELQKEANENKFHDDYKERMYM